MPLHSSRRPGPAGWFTVTTFTEAIGDQIARSLAPIIAVSLLGAGTATVGLLHALGLAMFLLLSIPLGHLGDQLARPTAMMTTSTTVRIVALGGGLLSWRFGLLDGNVGIGLLLGIMLIIGVADVTYTSGRSILIPQLVPVARVRSLMGRVQTSAQVGTSLAPLLLTATLALTAPPVGWAAAIIAYLGSLATQNRYRERPGIVAPTVTTPDRSTDDDPPRAAPPRRRLKDGMAHLLAEPTLCRVTASSSLHNAAAMAANTLLPVIALSEHGVAPSTFAAIGGIGAVAGIAGAASSSWITARLGLRAVRIGAALISSVGVACITLMVIGGGMLPGPPAGWIGLCFGLSGFCTSVSAVAGSDLLARLTPREMLGSVSGAQRTATMGVMPVSALLTGTLGAIAGTGAATIVWLTLALAAALPCIRLTEPSTS